MAKSTRPIIRIHDLSTNEIIDREMNDAEFAQWQEEKSIYETKQLEIAAKETERQAILNRIGLTADEAKLLLG